jgi:acetylornithine deacetylase/succinyl-diaminopimelate desuccinylase-like protein
VVLAVHFSAASGTAQTRTLDQALAREIFADMIGVNTTFERGNTTPVAQAVAKRFLAAGFPAADVQIVGATDKNRNVVVRYRGSGARRPILLIGHIDVVEALRSDWSLDPFTLTEKDGFFYGRGTSDMKDMSAIWVATLLHLKREGFQPDRDIILALTAGEEGGDDNGIRWLLANRRDLIDAVYCINGEGGDPFSKDGKVFVRNVQASEKVYMDVHLEVHNPGGHSSLPTKDNAIYHLTAALNRIAAYEFPLRLNEVTHAYFERAAGTFPPNVAADMRLVASQNDTAAARRLSDASPMFNAQLRTTCVATRLAAGHANNALPQTATANVNCRMLPDEHPDSVIATLRRVVDDAAVAVSPAMTPVPSPPSPLVPEVLKPVEQISASMWPGVPVVPSMETGATDGLALRNAGIPVYGISGVPLDEDDIRAHGRDERIRVGAFYAGVEFSYRLVKALAGGSP